MAIIEIISFGNELDLHLINSWIVVSSENRIGDIQKWLDEVEASKVSYSTVFTPQAMIKYYNMPEGFMSHTIRMDVGASFIYNGYKVIKVTENLCAVEENN